MCELAICARNGVDGRLVLLCVSLEPYRSHGRLSVVNRWGCAMTELPFFDPLVEPPSLPRVDRLPVRHATLDMVDLDSVLGHIDRAIALKRLDKSHPV